MLKKNFKIMTEEELKLEKLKIVYEQAGLQHRYFLNWRYFLTVGYFAILGSMVMAFVWCFKEVKELRDYLFWLPVSFSGASLLFLLLDRRIRDLYHTSRKVACMVEQEFNLGLHIKEKFTKIPECHKCKDYKAEGMFFALCFARNKHGVRSTTLSSIFDYMYIFFILLSLFLAIII